MEVRGSSSIGGVVELRRGQQTVQEVPVDGITSRPLSVQDDFVAAGVSAAYNGRGRGRRPALDQLRDIAEDILLGLQLLCRVVLACRVRQSAQRPSGCRVQVMDITSMAMEMQPRVVVVAGAGRVGGEDEGPLVGHRLLERTAHHPAFLLHIITITINAKFSGRTARRLLPNEALPGWGRARWTGGGTRG